MTRLKGVEWIEVRGERGALLFRLDTARLLIEIKPKGGRAELVDLRPYVAPGQARQRAEPEIRNRKLQAVDTSGEGLV